RKAGAIKLCVTGKLPDVCRMRRPGRGVRLRRVFVAYREQRTRRYSNGRGNPMIQHVDHDIAMVVAITKRIFGAALLLGLLAFRSSAQDLSDFKAQAFDPVAALGILTDATANETGAAPPATGLASPIVVDTLFGTSTSRIPIE